MRPSSGGARARTASLYTYVHTKCADAHTHRNPTAAPPPPGRGRKRGSHSTTIPRGVHSSHAGKIPASKEEEEQEEQQHETLRTPLGCSGDLSSFSCSAHNNSRRGTAENKQTKKNENSAHTATARALLSGNRTSAVVAPAYFLSLHRDSSSERARHTHNTAIRTVRAHARGALWATCVR